jgi:hypothetical protein
MSCEDVLLLRSFSVLFVSALFSKNETGVYCDSKIPFSNGKIVFSGFIRNVSTKTSIVDSSSLLQHHQRILCDALVLMKTSFSAFVSLLPFTYFYLNASITIIRAHSNYASAVRIIEKSASKTFNQAIVDKLHQGEQLKSLNDFGVSICFKSSHPFLISALMKFQTIIART